MRPSLCEYQTSGRQCLIPGTICPDVNGKGPWYCTWHHSTMTDPDFARDRKMFSDWIGKTRKDYKTIFWSTANEDELWRKINGM